MQRGADTLETLRCLDNHTVMINCIGMSDGDIHRVARVGKHVVWCAAFNIYMFGVG